MSDEGSGGQRAGFSWRRLSWRWVIGQIHLWLGLGLCVPLIVLGLTGSLLVFDDELRSLLGPRSSAGLVRGAARPVGEIVAAAHGAAPGRVATLYRAADPGMPATVKLAAASGSASRSEFTLVQVDPVSLAVTTDRRSGDRVREILDLHANLLTGDGSGRQVVGWLGIVMLALGVSGLVNWWPKPGQWRRAFAVRPGARGLRLHRELHRAIGIWTIAVLMIVSVSGVYLVFPQTIGAAVTAIFPVRDQHAVAAIRVEPRPDVEPIGIDDAIAIAREGSPESRVGFVFLPGRPDQPYRINLVLGAQERGVPMTVVAVDPWTRRAVARIDPCDFTVGETVLAWQHSLHAGRGLGWTWKILVFLCGLLPLLFAVTGAAIWWLRGRNKRALGAQRRAAVNPLQFARRTEK